MTTQIDSIAIPAEFVELARQWYDGQGCILYAISSTGNLTLGSIRPINDDGHSMSYQEWYYSLYLDLDCELSRLIRRLPKYTRGKGALKRFQQWAERTGEMLRKEYNLD